MTEHSRISDMNHTKWRHINVRVPWNHTTWRNNTKVRMTWNHKTWGNNIRVELNHMARQNKFKSGLESHDVTEQHRRKCGVSIIIHTWRNNAEGSVGCWSLSTHDGTAPKEVWGVDHHPHMTEQRRRKCAMSIIIHTWRNNTSKCAMSIVIHTWRNNAKGSVGCRSSSTHDGTTRKEVWDVDHHPHMTE